MTTSDQDRQLAWIDGECEPMCERVARWAAISSGSRNLDGLERMAREAGSELVALGADVKTIPAAPERVVDATGCVVEQPLGPLVTGLKHENAPLRVLLACHLDTVFAADDPFRDVSRPDRDTLRGPGVVDAKGGVIVLLMALEALERSAVAGRIGWRVALNCDEEIGSPGSVGVLRELARESAVGLVYEPALPGGALVSARKGSGNFTIVVRGVAAHAGREYERGRNAASALARLVLALEELGTSRPGVTVNVARLEGGGAYNVVPDLAIARFNVRVNTSGEQERVERDLRGVVAQAAEADGIDAELHGEFRAPPRPVSPTMQCLMDDIAACGADLAIPMQWRPTGGVCDGNRLAAAGLTTVDTLGPCGGGLHSSDEHLIVSSLAERARLSALFLMRLAAGEIDASRFASTG